MKEPLIDVANISAAFTKMYSKIFVRANSMRGLNSARGKIYGGHGKAMPPTRIMAYNGTLGDSRLFEDFFKARCRLFEVTNGS